MAEITLLTYWKVAKERKRPLITVTALSAFITAIMVFTAPREYTASVSVFPPASPVNLLSSFGSVGFSMMGGGSPTSVEALLFLVKSRRMAEGVVDHFNWTKRFQTTREKAIRKVRRMVNGYDISKGTIFVIEVTSGDPAFSAEVANFCVENLNVINEQLNLTSDKPLVKVIDKAQPPPFPNPRHLVKKVLGAILFSGIGIYFFFFFGEYVRMLREEEKQKTLAEDAEKILKEF
ncbi:MAG: hypothetical protein HY590_03180 [Candidatus Omnitrophica bacterium]|nr:hypothetical protein [Candidatus Omnitrophota bacterium]